MAEVAVERVSQGSQEESSDSGKVKLKKEVTLLNGIALIVGVIVGSGIFVSPKGVLLKSGSVYGSLIIWTLCGLISLIGSLCYSELGTFILKSGADYAYIHEAFGGLPAFLYLWVAVLVIVPAGNAITAMTFASYILHPFFPCGTAPDAAVSLLAAACITFLTAINCVNVKWATRTQDIFTTTKILALIMIILVGFIKLGMGSTMNFSDGFAGASTAPAAYATAFYSGLFSYSGWNYLNFVTEELKNPYVNLPRAIWISVPLVTTVYVLANIAYFAVLTPDEVLASNAVAVSFADKTLGQFQWVMPVFVAMSTFGGLNGAIFASSRLFFVGARQGHLPDGLALINIRSFTPIPALLFVCLCSCAYLMSSDVYSLINYTTFVEACTIGASITGLLYLRRTQPDRYRPIRINLFFPICFMFICAFLILFPIFDTPRDCLMGIAIVCSGIPVYMIGVKWTNKPKWFQEGLILWTARWQKLINGVEEEGKED